MLIAILPWLISRTLAVPCPNAANSESTETCIQYGEVERCWLVYVPEGIGANPALVVDIHGYSGCAYQQEETSGWRDIAGREKMVVVYPQGLQDLADSTDKNPSWNAGLCCGASQELDVDDMGFLKAMLVNLEESYGIDQQRMYWSGHSNGCSMAQRMATDASELVASVGCMSMYRMSELSGSYSAVPVIFVHGTGDLVVRYEAFEMEEGGQQFGAVENIKDWAGFNGCDSVAQTTQGEGFVATTYSNCARDTEVKLISLPGVGHMPFKNVSNTPPCEKCAPAALCYSEGACGFFDNATIMWGGIYSACNAGGASCGGCFTDTSCGGRKDEDTDVDTAALLWNFMERYSSPVITTTTTTTTAPETSTTTTTTAEDNVDFSGKQHLGVSVSLMMLFCVHASWF